MRQKSSKELVIMGLLVSICAIFALIALDYVLVTSLNKKFMNDTKEFREISQNYDFHSTEEDSFGSVQQCQYHELGYGYKAQTCLEGRSHYSETGFGRDFKSVEGVSMVAVYAAPAPMHFNPLSLSYYHEVYRNIVMNLDLDGTIIERERDTK